MNDLIERLTELKEWHIKTANSRKNLRKKAAHTMRADALSKAIAALSPVLPEDVVNVITGLNRLATRKVSNYSDETFGVPNPCRVETKAADMLERLARRLELSPNHSVDGIEARDATIKGIEQRIAELEAELEQVVKSATEIILDNAPEAMPALAVARGEARRMSEQPK